jgi:ATP-binding cassette subfamily E protein 1
VGLVGAEGKRFADASGGEMQLAAIAKTIAQDVDLYFFDEPSSYLDIVNRLHVARIVRNLGETKSVVVVEHDLAILDYLADQVHLLYGESAAFGVVSHPMATRTAINTYLGGYLRDENVRFRPDPIVFTAHPPRAIQSKLNLVTFDTMEMRYPSFHLKVEGGDLHKGETVGIVGPNATGKTTFVELLAGVEKPTSGMPPPGVKVSYKPQYLKAAGEANLKERADALAKGEDFDSAFFQNELVQSLSLAQIMEVPLARLSGGELQRVAIALTLAREATLYLLDEPSAYLDVDERMNASKVIRRAVEKRGATALVVDHDVYFLDLLADRMMVFHGKGEGIGEGPYPMREGMNRLLKEVGVTFRRDEETLRPRVNKGGSVLDREQRARGEYYYEPLA